MLNKGLLLASGGRKKLDGIWEITVGIRKDGASTMSDSYGYNMFQDYGSVTRKDPIDKIFGTNGESFLTLAGCSSYSSSGAPRTTLNFGETHSPNLSETYLYLHIRKDNQIYSLIFNYDLNVRLCVNTKLLLFNANDVGKTYRMYIGPLDTPPPWL